LLSKFNIDDRFQDNNSANFQSKDYNFFMRILVVEDEHRIANSI